MMPANYSKYEELTEFLDLGMNCGFCSEPLHEEDIGMYDHDGGIPVMGHLINQWVYVTCRKCNHQWSWDKLLRRGKLQGKCRFD